MPVIDLIPLILLINILLIATITDIRYHKIPNWCTYPVMVIGIGYHTYMHGLAGLRTGIGGLFIGIFLLLIFHLKFGMGAGDVKLMGAVGALIGPREVFSAFLFTAVIGGVYALVLLACHGQLKETIKRYWVTMTTLFITKSFAGYTPPSKTIKGVIMPYGVAIAFGTSLSVLMNLIGKVDF